MHAKTWNKHHYQLKIKKKTLASKLTSNEDVSKKFSKLISCELEMEYMLLGTGNMKSLNTFMNPFLNCLKYLTIYY